MGKFDVVFKSTKSSKMNMWFPEYFFGILATSILFDDRLELDISVRKFDLQSGNKSYYLMIDDLQSDDFFAGISFTPQDLPSSDMPFDVCLSDSVMNIYKKVLDRMKKFNISIEQGGSSRYKVFASSINYIRDLHKNNPQKLCDIEKRVHERMIQLISYMKLLREFETPEYQHMIGYLATSSALMNYLVYGNEGQVLFENCLPQYIGNCETMSTTPASMIIDLSNIGHYVDNVKLFSPKLLDLACCKDGKDSILTDKVCNQSKELFENSMFFVPAMLQGFSSGNKVDDGIINGIKSLIENEEDHDNFENSEM